MAIRLLSCPKVLRPWPPRRRPFAAVRHPGRNLHGVQFHPEVTHTPHGVEMLRNFLYEICGCEGTWRMSDFVETAAAEVRAKVQGARVICGLSGGWILPWWPRCCTRPSETQLTCIFVDNGLLRKNERDLVETTFRDHFDVDLRVVDASKPSSKISKASPNPKRNVVALATALLRCSRRLQPMSRAR